MINCVEICPAIQSYDGVKENLTQMRDDLPERTLANRTGEEELLAEVELGLEYTAPFEGGDPEIRNKNELIRISLDMLETKALSKGERRAGILSIIGTQIETLERASSGLRTNCDRKLPTFSASRDGQVIHCSSELAEKAGEVAVKVAPYRR